jgi:5-methylcytosine-specific restriction protein A
MTPQPNSTLRISAKVLNTIKRSHLLQAVYDFQNDYPHHFVASTGYDLVHEGVAYPPKAILGLAGRHALGRTLEPEDFSGGEGSTCFRILRREGFIVNPKSTELADFEVGRTYNRRTEIHQKYMGQEQGGISTPAEWPYIFLFTGDSGDQYGYRDQWNQDQTVFTLAGEGQEGDMEMKAGNLAILEHTKNSKELHLFKALGKSQPVEYMGRFQLKAPRETQGKDKLGVDRKVILFDLEPYPSSHPTADPAELERETEKYRGRTWAVPPKGHRKPRRRQISEGTVVERDPEVRAYVLDLANGHCEACGKEGPFRDLKGRLYLEVHHVCQLAHGGSDTHDNAVSLCPNCHRAFHHGASAVELVTQIYRKVGRLVKETP